MEGNAPPRQTDLGQHQRGSRRPLRVRCDGRRKHSLHPSFALHEGDSPFGSPTHRLSSAIRLGVSGVIPEHWPRSASSLPQRGECCSDCPAVPAVPPDEDVPVPPMPRPGEAPSSARAGVDLALGERTFVDGDADWVRSAASKQGEASTCRRAKSVVEVDALTGEGRSYRGDRIAATLGTGTAALHREATRRDNEEHAEEYGQIPHRRA